MPVMSIVLAYLNTELLNSEISFEKTTFTTFIFNQFFNFYVERFLHCKK